MSAGEEEQNKDERKGFAGLSSLVSDVDASLPPPAKQEATVSAGTSSAECQDAPKKEQSNPQFKTQPHRAQSPSYTGSSPGMWILGVAVVIGILWLIGVFDEGSSTPRTSNSPSVKSEAVVPSSPTLNTPLTQLPAATQFGTLLRLEEAKPSVGRDFTLSVAQIRFCLAEDIRLDAARGVLNNYSDADVGRFNVMVADYNSRCGSFRYRTGALESARRDVEPHRSQLQAEGRSRFSRNPSTGSLSKAAPTRPAADETVRAVQRKLNELGYNAGPADGLMGSRTRSAIVAFQRDYSLAVTGIVNQTLVSQLQRALPHSGATGSR